MFLNLAALRALSRARAVLIAEVVDDGITVAALARQAAMPRGRFIAAFSALYGTTPHQARIAARLDRAQQLLRRGEAVTDVCMAVGCTSLGSFSAAFKQRTGLSPSQWQRAQRTLVQVAARRPMVGGCFGLLTALPPNALRR